MTGVYNPLLVCLSLVVAFLASYTAVELSGGLNALASAKRRPLWLVRGSVSMGLGILSMHFTGMYALQMSPGIEYAIWKVALSVGVAIAASMAALWLAFTLRTLDVENLVVKRLGAAFVMAIAITGMHYVGMSAANFAAGSLCLSGEKLDANW